MNKKTFHLASGAEDRFIELFTEVFGIENTECLAVQYPFVDIYGNNRNIDFALESDNIKIAIEIDGEIFHDKRKISDEKYYDELFTSKQHLSNSGLGHKHQCSSDKN